MTSLPNDDALQRKTEQLAQSEARYRYALMAGRLAHWETDLTTGTRIWSDESMALFGLKLDNGIGQVGGDNDEFRRAVHPDDQHLIAEFNKLADSQDWFPAEYRIVRPDGSVRWLSGGGQVVARGPDGKAQHLVHVVADITERKNSEEHVRELLRELTHRGKNLLAVIQAIASQTGRSSDTFDEFQERFTHRLQGLAASHDLLVMLNWKGASLANLVRDQLRVFTGTDGPSTNSSGPDIYLKPTTTEAIGLALHELATNAIKHGALSVPTGRVTVTWSIEQQDDGERLVLRWTERGGPATAGPARKGFGHIVFERIVSRSLNGEVTMDFAPEGLDWRLSVPTIDLQGRRTIFKDQAGWEESE